MKPTLLKVILDDDNKTILAIGEFIFDDAVEAVKQILNTEGTERQNPRALMHVLNRICPSNHAISQARLSYQSFHRVLSSIFFDERIMQIHKDNASIDSLQVIINGDKQIVDILATEADDDYEMLASEMRSLVNFLKEHLGCSDDDIEQIIYSSEHHKRIKNEIYHHLHSHIFKKVEVTAYSGDRRMSTSTIDLDENPNFPFIQKMIENEECHKSAPKKYFISLIDAEISRIEQSEMCHKMGTDLERLHTERMFVDFLTPVGDTLDFVKKHNNSREHI